MLHQNLWFRISFAAAIAVITMVAFVAAVGVGAATATAQSVQVSNWRTYSSMRAVAAADVDSKGRIWAATSGGVFVYDQANDTVIEFRNIGALLSLDVTSVLCDRSNTRVFVGCSDGGLHVVTEDLVWTAITDIRRATQYPRRAINDFALDGSTLYMATGFGVVSYDVDRNVFIETVDRIATMGAKTSVHGITMFQDSIWLATDSGVAVAAKNVPTLRLPSVWTSLSTAAGLPRASVTGVRANATNIFVSVGNGVFKADGHTFSLLYGSSDPILSLASINGELTFSDKKEVRTLDAALPVTWPGPLVGHTALMLNNVMSHVAFVQDKSIAIWQNNVLTPVEVNSPISNQFANLAMDTDGGLWVATDVDPPRTGVGVAYFNGSVWRNFTSQTDDAIKTNACYRVSALADGTVWIGTWGSGAVRAVRNNGAVELTRFTSSNSSLVGIAVDNNYVLVGDVALDRNGNTCLVNEQSGTKLMATIRTDGSGTSFENCSDPRNNFYRSIAVDGAGNKWIGSPFANGIVVVNDDLCNIVRSSNTQLPDNTVNAVRVDRLGAMWIGTIKGVAVISGPSAITNTSIPFLRRITALTTVVVNDIAVDALNYKWIATTGGVFVLNEDGTEVLATITAANSPLLDDNVRSVVVDDKTGTAFFGTSVGLSTARTQSIRPVETYALSFSPQPYRPSQSGALTIDGLAADSDVRIMTIDGALVAALQSRGRQALWDGTDVQGRFVTPGVYVVHVVSASSKESAAGKIVVTR
ncbi:MAG: hypothetical protein SGJ05_04160 [bacterium]|nr:hypothetical protein [bacterium]